MMGYGIKMAESRLKRFGQSLGNTFRNLGTATGKVLEGLEKSDKEMNEKIKKATGGIE